MVIKKRIYKYCILSEKKEKKHQETQQGIMVIHAKKSKDQFSFWCQSQNTWFKLSKTLLPSLRSLPLAGEWMAFLVQLLIPWMNLVKKTPAYLCCLLVHFVCFVHYWCILVCCYFWAFLFITLDHFWRIFWTPDNNWQFFQLWMIKHYN